MREPFADSGQRSPSFVRIAHDESASSLYAHLLDYTVRSGDRVHAGAIIGRVGRTGMHTSGSHLHLGFFEADEVCEQSYADRAGKYQGQTGVTLPKA